MRTLILALLACGTLYYAWTRFGSDEVAEGKGADVANVEFPANTSGGSKGAFSSRRPPSSAEQEGSTPEPAAREPELAQVRTEVPAPAPSQPQDLFDLNALGDPLYEGSLLLHRPKELKAYLSGRGEGLSSTRRRLLISYWLLADGMHDLTPTYSDGLEDAKDVSPAELGLLRRALSRQAVAVREASASPSGSPLVLGVTMALMDRQAEEAAIAGDWAKAASLLSELLLAEIDAPWAPEDATMKRWARSLEDAQASYRWSPDGDWPSVEVVVEQGDNLVGIRKTLLAQSPNMTICTGLIERSNKLGTYLQEGQTLRVPTERVRTIIDLSAKWLFYMHGNEVVAAWPVAIGRKGKETTPGRYTAGEKTPEPPWFPPGRSMVPYGDPENPLGTRWIGLDGSNGLGIHGTWAPESVGSMASDGCIRLANDNVEQLFEIIPKGTEVWVRP